MAPSRGISRTFSLRNIAIKHTSHQRSFSAVPRLSSGHNRWSKIKHDKEKNDAAKNRQRSVFSSEIATTSKLFGPDPNNNPRLADLIVKAKREGFAKASIEAAIARGQGRSASGAKLETVTFEGILPGNVGVVIECETDNKARTMMELKNVLKDAGGSATPSAYLFEKKGKIVLENVPENGIDQILDVALDAGAEDVDEADDGEVVVLCEPTATNVVREKIAAALSLTVKSAEIAWIPVKDTMVELRDPGASNGLSSFIDALQDREPNASVAVNVN